jgi:8-oxo-dGTP diphosphatase
VIIGAGVVLTRPDGSILLGRRVYAHEEPAWCLPGGKVDPGESFEAAAVREVFEETGIRLAGELHRLGLILGTLNGAPCLTAAFAAEVTAETSAKAMEPAKIADWTWYPRAALPAPLFEPSRNVLDLFAGRRVPGVTAYRFSAME